MDDFRDPQSMEAKNNFLNDGFSHPFYGVETATLSGNGYETLDRLDARDQRKIDQILGDWADGFPQRKYNSLLGDGTVLEKSSSLDGAENHVIYKNHLELVSSAEGMVEVIDFLGITGDIISPTQTFADTAITLMSPDSEVEIIDEPSVKNAKGISVIMSPKSKDYKVKLDVLNDDSTVIVAQFLKNKTLWKEYKVNKGIKKGLLKFNNINAEEDILEIN